MKLSLLLIVSSLGLVVSCPLKTVDSRQGCYCGIEIDGTNYIHCRPYSIDSIPEFTRSYVYDTLNLSSNFIRRIGQRSFHQLKVKRIILQQNLIESIDKDAFEQNLLNHLEELRLDAVENGSPEFLCHGRWLKLRFLQLNGFQFDHFQSCFGQLSRLETLIIENSQINKLSNQIYQLPNLIDLTLRFNQIEYLSFEAPTPNKISSVQRVNLTFNQLRTVPLDVFSRFPQLTVFDLSNNFIEHLPKIVERRTSIFLNLSHNLINYLENVDEQHRYDVSFNPLCTVDKMAANLRISVRSPNKLNCDCRLAFALFANRTKRNEFVGNETPFADQTFCSTPARFNGFPLKDLTFEQLFSHCEKTLPSHCREIEQIDEIEHLFNEISSTRPTTTQTSTTTTTKQISPFRLKTFSAKYQNENLFISWDFDPTVSLEQLDRIHFQILLEQESTINSQIIRRTGRIPVELKKYSLSQIPSNKNYYVCLLLTQSNYGTDKYCREIRSAVSTTTTVSILSKQTLTQQLLNNRSILFGFLVGTILTSGLLLALAFFCHLRSKRERSHRAASSFLQYQHQPTAEQQQQTQYLYADQTNDDELLYSNSLISSPKFSHRRKFPQKNYLVNNQSWYRRAPLPTMISAGPVAHCCFHHHHHTPDTTISTSSTATTSRRMTSLSSQYSQQIDKEPMTSTSIMSNTSFDEQQSQINDLSPGKHLYEELNDETLTLRQNQTTNYFL